MVSEAGASVYSASAYASAELPDMDVSLRGAVSIARRLQDPLAELVKIDPKSIGVGQYQHDLPESSLNRSLDSVVEDCVNAVGVDVNSASAPLLRRVSGISESLAGAIVAHRDENGPFRTRTALSDVPRLGPKAFEQCAGFLRIRGGDEPLDVSGVHPEAYPVVRKMVERTKIDVAALMGDTGKLHQIKAKDYVDETFGLPTVSDILAELEKPGRDPRPAFRTATFAEGVHKIADLRIGMLLEGVVTNVAAFGAFVDVGVHQDGLVHVSAMSKEFVSDPRDVAKSGDVVKVKVLDVDEARKRISLTLRLDDEPGAGKPKGRGGDGAGRSRTAGATPAAARDGAAVAARAVAVTAPRAVPAGVAGTRAVPVAVAVTSPVAVAGTRARRQGWRRQGRRPGRRAAPRRPQARSDERRDGRGPAPRRVRQGLTGSAGSPGPVLRGGSALLRESVR